jgi:subtilase family serine protease
VTDCGPRGAAVPHPRCMQPCLRDDPRVRRGVRSNRPRAGGLALIACAALVGVGADRAAAAPGSGAVGENSRAASDPARASNPPKRRVILLGLRQRGRPARFANRVSDPSSPRYRSFLSSREYRQRFSASRGDRRRVRRYLAAQEGVRKVLLSSDRSVILAVLTPGAGRRIFCARGAGAPTKGLCKPRPLRGQIRQISAGEVYQLGGNSSRAGAPGSEGARSGSPRGCAEAIATGGFTPNQLSTAYGADGLRARGLEGSGIRVATLSSQEVDAAGFATWAQCFGFAMPEVRQLAMPGASMDTATDPEETVLDVEALASLAPGLDRITPIFVPLDQSFGNSFVLFMFGALDRPRQDGRLPHILSISDGVCESRFTSDQLQLGRRLLAQAAALGITTLAASGDLGFQGCFINKPGALFPSSSPLATSVGGTDLTLTAANAIADQIVWSTFATDPDQGVGSGGGPSKVWGRPSFQLAPGIGPELQRGGATRLAPDLAAMASLVPGLATFDPGGGGWGTDGGTSAATPLTAAIVALVLEQELDAGRGRLGSLSPLLYQLARADYGSIFFDVTRGTSSREPNSAAGQSPAGGAAQPGYDLATGLGSLKAGAFADAVASQQPPAP